MKIDKNMSIERKEIIDLKREFWKNISRVGRGERRVVVLFFVRILISVLVFGIVDLKVIGGEEKSLIRFVD